MSTRRLCAARARLRCPIPTSHARSTSGHCFRSILFATIARCVGDSTLLRAHRDANVNEIAEGGVRPASFGNERHRESIDCAIRCERCARESSQRAYRNVTRRWRADPNVASDVTARGEMARAPASRWLRQAYCPLRRFQAACSVEVKITRHAADARATRSDETHTLAEISARAIRRSGRRDVRRAPEEPMKPKRALLLSFGVLALAGTVGCAGGRFDVVRSSPPPLLASAPSELVVLPGTDIYAAPGIGAGLYFTDGWWWRPWNGRWYRSRYYGGDWRLVSQAPSFYRSIPHDWRDQYHRREWRGDPWRYDHISRDEAVSQWDRWKRERHWRRGHDSHDDDSGRSGRSDRYGDPGRRDPAGQGDDRRSAYSPENGR